MADDISVPIRLPTDSSSVSAAKDVVAGLAEGMKALGPAAAAGSTQAQAQMKALGAAAQAAQKEVARAQAQQATRESFGNTPARSAEEAKARQKAEEEAGRAAVKAIDDERKAADAAEKARIKEREAAEKAAAKEAATAQKAAAKAAAEEQRKAAAQARAEEKAAQAQARAAAKESAAEERRIAAEKKAAAKEAAAEQRKATAAAKASAREEAKTAKAAAKSKAEGEKRAAQHARDTADIQRAFMKGAADKRAADMKELQSVAMGTVAVVAAVASAAAAISVQFVKALVWVQAFRESTMGAFRALLGSATAAGKTFIESIKTADQIGIGYQDALSGVNKLIAKGFKADEAQQLVKAMADLRAVVPDANIGNLLLAITQIKSKGVLQMEELQGQIAEAGLSVSVVLEEIGKKIGKSGQEVRKLISEGKISADQGVAGIMAAIQKTTGKPIGKAAEEASKSLGGLLSRLEQIPQGLLLMADASKGVGRLKDVLGNVLAAFAPSTKGGQALSAAIGRLGDAFATFLGGFEGKSGAKTLEDFANALAVSADRAAALVKSFGELSGPAISGFIKGFSEANKLIDGGKAKSGADGYAELGKALGSIATSVGMLTAFSADLNLFSGSLGQLLGLAGQSKAVSVGLGDMIVAALGPLALLDDLSVIGTKISALWSQLTAAISGLSADVKVSATSIGSNLIAGIISGMMGAVPGLTAAVQGVAALVTGAAQSSFKIKSPSRVWADDIGYQLPAGAAEGVYDGAPLMARAARDVAGLSTGAGAGAAASVGGMGGGGGVTIGQIGPFYARTAADAQAIADAVEERVRAIIGELSYA